MSAPTLPAISRTGSPYKGLDHYEEQDAPLFFGREVECDLVVANLLSARLTLLYGQSGVGKSSLLHAGVVPRLREDGDGTFAVEFPRAVNQVELAVSFLVSIREDALARLDRFKGRIPSLFGNYLRVDRLGREAGRDAIVRPLEEYEDRVAGDERMQIEPQLVEVVLDQVRVGNVELGQAGAGVIDGGSARESRIEAPFLQLVLTRLWEEESAAGSRVLRLETLDRLGGAARIVPAHLDAAMAKLSGPERDVAARVLHFLVTPSGTKIAHRAFDLAEYAEVSADVVGLLLA